MSTMIKSKNPVTSSLFFYNSGNTEFQVRSLYCFYLMIRRDHETTASVAPGHLQAVQAPLPSAELHNEMPEVNWTQTWHLHQLNKKHAVGQGCKILINAGQLATRGSHSITQQIEVSAIPTFIILNNPASALALPFPPPHVFIPSPLWGEDLRIYP